MKKFASIYSNRINRFVIVGIANATISFGILNLSFYYLSQGKIVSSIIGTSCALVFSFVLNRGFVFSDKSRRIYKQLTPFVIITISGSLVVLNLTYIFTLKVLLNGHESLIITQIKTLFGITPSKNFVDINLSTIVGAVVAMIWNYNGYRLFVFKGAKPTSRISTSMYEAETTRP